MKIGMLEVAILLGDLWQTVEAFQEEPNEGYCWIIYKGRRVEAYHMNYTFLFSKYSTSIFSHEHITFAQSIPIPEFPPNEN